MPSKKKAIADAISKAVHTRRASVLQDAVPVNERLEDFIVRVSTDLERPMHLGKALDILNHVGKRPVRLLWSVPPRHGKSLSILHLIAQIFTRNPRARVAYITNTETLALAHSRQIRAICERAGVELSKDVSSAQLWETASGGMLRAVGVGGNIMGFGFDLVVVDDPYKDRKHVDSVLERERIQSWFDGAAMTRLQPNASIIVVHTRYNIYDIIGTLAKRDEDLPDHLKVGWQVENVPAVSEVEIDDKPVQVALWPKMYSVDYFMRIKANNEYEFSAMYQGRPVPRGGQVFRDVVFYTPEERHQLAIKKGAIGIDLAYSVKSYADYSVAISAVLADNIMYITEVVRLQAELPAFAAHLKRMRALTPGATIYWQIGALEKPHVQTLLNLGIYVKTELAQALGNKLGRAGGVATAWNAGRVRIPDTDAAWIQPFIDEVLSFTGLGGGHDDQVDALTNVYHPLLGKPVDRGVGQKRLVPF